MKRHQGYVGIFLGLCLAPFSAYSAIPIDLSKQPSTFLKSAIEIKRVSQDIDFNKTQHIRITQSYHGYPVWGGDGVVHMPSNSLTSSTKMNGKLYNNLQADLPNATFNNRQSDLAMQHAVIHYQQQVGAQPEISNKKSYLMVYVDKENKAHWAFHLQFYAAPLQANGMPAKPTYIMDAETFAIYKNWDDIKTDTVESGGVGGNLKTGELMYDNNHLANFLVERNPLTQMCSLQNNYVIVKDDRNQKLVEFSCVTPSAEHNNLYWNILDDQANGGFSPNNDAIFTISQLKIMYQNWYGIAPVTENGHAAAVTVYTHAKMENAYWDGKVNNEWLIKLGDGASRMYPSTATGVIAHELGHGFTEQHSNLVYAEQSGGLNESFSDMADQAAQFYALGKNNWMHDAEIMKADGKALRYLDEPTKDCENYRTPGESCSINHMRQYKQTTNVHYSSGLFNHVFYLLGTSQNWNTKKAFDVMVKANMHYWTPNTTFAEAACGVMSAAADYQYDRETVIAAFDLVGIDVRKC
jgi:pseudolysin